MFILENLKNIKNTIKITYNPSGHRYLLKNVIPYIPLYVCMHILYLWLYALKPSFHVSV